MPTAIGVVAGWRRAEEATCIPRALKETKPAVIEAATATPTTFR
jgi:hypothetical protein